MIPKPNWVELAYGAHAVRIRAKKSADIALAHEQNGHLDAAATSHANVAMFTKVAAWLEAESTAMREAADKREAQARRDELERSPEKRAAYEQELFDTPLRRS